MSETNHRVLTTPVIFLVFNRPELVARVFERIRAVRPSRLFVVADGPRPDRLGEAEKCTEVRRLIETGIDWPCDVVHDYSEINLGCGKRVASGITNAFSQVEEAIILEDDCLPDLTFFRFCSELLEKYRNEPRIGMISGSHHQKASSHEGESYYFCRYGNIWGWATWRRAWSKFDHAMGDYLDWKKSGALDNLFHRKSTRFFWGKVWDRTAGSYDTWDYQWTFCYMRHGLLGVLPKVALIENIGFGVDATHTFIVEVDSPKSEAMSFPLRHPARIEPDFEAEERASQRWFSEKTFVQRVGARIRRWCGS